MIYNHFLIVSTTYPYNGGAATVAYLLHDFLTKRGYTSVCIFIDNQAHRDGKLSNPDNFPNVLTAPLCKLQKFRMDDYLFLKEKLSHILSKNYIILAFNYLAPIFSRKIFPTAKIYYMLTGCSYINNNNVINVEQLINGQINLSLVNPLEREAIVLSDYIVPNTYLIKNLFEHIYMCKIMPPIDLHEIFRMDPSLKDKNTDKDRIYQLVFICSKYSRKVKNIDLAVQIFSSFKNEPCLAIGAESSHYFTNMPWVTCPGFLNQKQVCQFLSKSKLLIVTSHIESYSISSVEAAQCGCLVLASKNVGATLTMHPYFIMDDYQPEKWIDQIRNILSNYQYFQKIFYHQYDKTIPIEYLWQKYSHYPKIYISKNLPFFRILKDKLLIPLDRMPENIDPNENIVLLSYNDLGNLKNLDRITEYIYVDKIYQNCNPPTINQYYFPEDMKIYYWLYRKYPTKVIYPINFNFATVKKRNYILLYNYSSDDYYTRNTRIMKMIMSKFQKYNFMIYGEHHFNDHPIRILEEELEELVLACNMIIFLPYSDITPIYHIRSIPYIRTVWLKEDDTEKMIIDNIHGMLMMNGPVDALAYHQRMIKQLKPVRVAVSIYKIPPEFDKTDNLPSDRLEYSLGSDPIFVQEIVLYDIYFQLFYALAEKENCQDINYIMVDLKSDQNYCYQVHQIYPSYPAGLKIWKINNIGSLYYFKGAHFYFLRGYYHRFYRSILGNNKNFSIYYPATSPIKYDDVPQYNVVLVHENPLYRKIFHKSKQIFFHKFAPESFVNLHLPREYHACFIATGSQNTKNHLLFIDLLKYLESSQKNRKFIYVGNKKEINNIAKSFKYVHLKIYHQCSRPEMVRIYNMSKVNLLFSGRDAFPRVIVESGATGCFNVSLDTLIDGKTYFDNILGTLVGSKNVRIINTASHSVSYVPDKELWEKIDQYLLRKYDHDMISIVCKKKYNLDNVVHAIYHD